MQIVKIPMVNSLGKTKGCEQAPNRIISELSDIYSNEKGKVVEVKEENIHELRIDPANLEDSNKEIHKESKKILSKKKFCVFLGGDHSISYPLIRAFSETFENSGLVVFDAHADCMHDFSPPTHEDWLRTAAEHNIKAENILLVGLRNIHPIEAKFLAEKKIRHFMQKDISNNPENICDTIMETARKFNSLYLSIDIDVVDPAFAPAVAYPEPGGFSSREILSFVRRLGMLKNLKAADIAEVNPTKDLNNITSKLAAKIISELVR